MKIAISVPDPVVDAAERLAKARRVPCSQVCSKALEAYAAQHDAVAITAKLDAVYAAAEATLDHALASAQYASLSHEAR